MAFDGIVLSRVVEALNKRIATGRISKIYTISQNELLMNVRAHNKNQKLLVSIHPMYARVQLTDLNYPTPDSPNALTMLMRKHMDGAFIADIEQVGLDRILKLTLKGRNDFKDEVTYYAYIEIMGKYSNFILTYENNKIIECLKRVSPSESSRILQPGIIYEYPPLLEKKNPFVDFYTPTDQLVKTYAGFGKDLANEVTHRMHLGMMFDTIMNDIKESDKLYIVHHNNKDYYHVLPLTNLSEDYEVYDLFEGLDVFYDKRDQKDRIKQQTNDLSRFIRNEYTKNVNKLKKLEMTLFDSQNSDDLRIKGDLLYASLHLIKKGMKEVTVDNYYDGTKMTIPLDERYDGKTNANKYYNKYQKAKNSLKVLQEQIDLTKEEINYFDRMMTLIENADYYDAMEMKEELENLGYLKKKMSKSIRKKKKHPHYQTLKTKDGVLFYVGKNNIQNDYVTFKKAKKTDYWFHVKNMPGSHVIVHSDNLDEYTIRLAAGVAAYYSKGKDSSSVPVNYTQVKTLKKPGGNKPGLVLLGHYKTIYIDPDSSVLKELEKVEER